MYYVRLSFEQLVSPGKLNFGRSWGPLCLFGGCAVGLNDGCLHAFRIAREVEAFSFVVVQPDERVLPVCILPCTPLAACIQWDTFFMVALVYSFSGTKCVYN